MQSAEGRRSEIRESLAFGSWIPPQNNQRTGCERHGLIMTYAVVGAIVSHHSDFPNTRFYGKTGPSGSGGCANAHRPHQLRELKTASCYSSWSSHRMGGARTWKGPNFPFTFPWLNPKAELRQWLGLSRSQVAQGGSGVSEREGRGGTEKHVNEGLLLG